MSTTWDFYADAGLTTLATGGATIASGAGPTDRIIYFGSPVPGPSVEFPDAGNTLQAASAPGTDPIQVSVVDAESGSGAASTAIAMALSSAALASATPGAALTVGTTLNSGPAGAIPIYVRTTQGALTVGAYSDLSLETNAVVEA